jgi:hypothetical protein
MTSAFRAAYSSTWWTVPTLIGTPSRSRMNSMTPGLEPRGPEGVIQCDASLERLLVDELAAHPVLGRQIADRL